MDNASIHSLGTEPETLDVLEAQAARLERELEDVRERARTLRSDRSHAPISLKLIAAEMGVTVRPLEDAARSGKLEAWRLGGAERGDLITTRAKVMLYLGTQPAARVTAPKKTATEPASVVVAYDELAARRARGGR